MSGVRKSDWQDGIIVGTHIVGGQCDNCGNRALLLKVKKVVLPTNIKPDARLIMFHGRDEKDFHSHIGLSCGCYAKFHRQIAHVSDSLRNG